MKMKIGVCTILVGNPKTYKPYTEKNHMSYCSMHGYGYKCFKEALVNDVPIPFTKPEAILQMFDEGYDYVFYTDADSFFLNKEIKLESFIQDDYDFIATGSDFDMVGAGHLMFKNSDWSRKFIEKWVGFRQCVSTDVIEKFKKITTHIFEDVLFGNLSDQIPLNMLVSMGDVPPQENWFDIFCKVNFYTGNKFRKYSHKTHAPTTDENVKRTNNLIFEKWRKNIIILKQSRVECYPNKYDRNIFMIHFVFGKKRISKFFTQNLLD